MQQYIQGNGYSLPCILNWCQLALHDSSNSLCQSGEALLSTSFWRGDDRSSPRQNVSDDRSSETVWRGDDRSSDRHFFPLIDHRKQFGGEMIALMTGTFFRWSIIGKINRFAVHKSDHLPVKTFPMIDHLTAKLFPMIDQRNKVPVRRAIISPSNCFRWSINGNKCRSRTRNKFRWAIISPSKRFDGWAFPDCIGKMFWFFAVRRQPYKQSYQ